MRKWLKEKRIEKGLTMAQLAEKLLITESYYSLIEAGERQKKMDVVIVVRLSKALDIPITDIIIMEAAEEEGT